MTDEEIKKLIQDELKWDIRVDDSNLIIDVNEGDVKLEGRVGSFQARNAALKDTYNIRGVRTVQNNLKVDYTGTIPDDDELASNIKSALSWDAGIDTAKIDVDVSSGTATLKGTVNSLWKKFQAEKDAGNMLGVLYVKNEISVVPTESVNDEMIAKQITEAMRRNRYTEPEKINVEVSDGRVRLSGTAGTLFVKETATDIAAYTVGVKEVDVTELKTM